MPVPHPTNCNKRDACKWNQERKKNIYQNSSFISAPSQWLTRMAENSILAKGSVEFDIYPTE